MKYTLLTNCLVMLMLLTCCDARESSTVPVTQAVAKDTTNTYIGKISELQTALLDSLAKKYKFNYSVGISCEQSGDAKPCSFEISIPKHQFKKNNLGAESQKIAELFDARSEPSPMVKDIVIKFISETGGSVGLGSEITYSYPRN